MAFSERLRNGNSGHSESQSLHFAVSSSSTPAFISSAVGKIRPTARWAPASRSGGTAPTMMHQPSSSQAARRWGARTAGASGRPLTPEIHTRAGDVIPRFMPMRRLPPGATGLLKFCTFGLATIAQTARPSQMYGRSWARYSPIDW